MTMRCPDGYISFLELQNEYGGNNPISFNEYYRGVGLVTDIYRNRNIPTSGQISMNQFYCTANDNYTITISQNTVNFNVQDAFINAFGPSVWTNSDIKKLIINPGVTIGSTIAGTPKITKINGGIAVTTGGISTSAPTYALYAKDTVGFGGTMIIYNHGTIIGAGGTAVTKYVSSGSTLSLVSAGAGFFIGTSTGGAGGGAIYTNMNLKIDNSDGHIYGGGGGGGGGGNGNLVDVSNPIVLGLNPLYGGDVYGGIGGIGQGYNQTNTNGQNPITIFDSGGFINAAGNDFYIPINSNNVVVTNGNVNGGSFHVGVYGRSTVVNLGLAANLTNTYYFSHDCSATINGNICTNCNINFYLSENVSLFINPSLSTNLTINAYGDQNSINNTIIYDRSNAINFIFNAIGGGGDYSTYDTVIRNGNTVLADPQAAALLHAGVGGAGGTIGNSGSSGSPGPSGSYDDHGYGGGESGCYLYGNSHVTWINQGDVLGQVK